MISKSSNWPKRNRKWSFRSREVNRTRGQILAEQCPGWWHLRKIKRNLGKLQRGSNKNCQKHIRYHWWYRNRSLSPIKETNRNHEPLSVSLNVSKINTKLFKMRKTQKSSFMKISLNQQWNWENPFGKKFYSIGSRTKKHI